MFSRTFTKYVERQNLTIGCTVSVIIPPSSRTLRSTGDAVSVGARLVRNGQLADNPGVRRPRLDAAWSRRSLSAGAKCVELGACHKRVLRKVPLERFLSCGRHAVESEDVALEDGPEFTSTIAAAGWERLTEVRAVRDHAVCADRHPAVPDRQRSLRTPGRRIRLHDSIAITDERDVLDAHVEHPGRHQRE